MLREEIREPEFIRFTGCPGSEGMAVEAVDGYDARRFSMRVMGWGKEDLLYDWIVAPVYFCEACICCHDGMNFLKS